MALTRNRERDVQNNKTKSMKPVDLVKLNNTAGIILSDLLLSLLYIYILDV